jgi:uncharacterized radical SAM superfamily Fe-S cluster-containing enzyme
MQLSVQQEIAIKKTMSLCPECRQQIPADVFETDGKVFLRKRCPQHGNFTVLINSDRRFYYESCGAGCACQTTVGHSDDIIEKAATCIALIEIVESCNLKCPTCYADSPFTVPADIKALSLDEFRSRVNAVIDRKGPLDILQLSGGEPTIHPQFLQLLEGVLADKRVGYTLINTNGLLLAGDDDFVEKLGELHQAHRRFEIYLQFDGPQEAGQVALRGVDLRKVRQKAIERTGRHGIPTTLAMTVTDDNSGELGGTLRYGLAQPSVRGITFQPMFFSGRTHHRFPDPSPTGHSLPVQTARRLNVADIALGIIEQSEGLLSEKDFTPLPCGDPNCHMISYVLRKNGQWLPVSHFVDFSTVQGFLKDRVDFDIEDLKKCGCESEPLGQILKQFEIGPDHVFRLFIKPFMDAWTYDQDRIDRCCVHVIGEGGKLESFCRHYALQS